MSLKRGFTHHRNDADVQVISTLLFTNEQILRGDLSYRDALDEIDGWISSSIDRLTVINDDNKFHMFNVEEAEKLRNVIRNSLVEAILDNGNSDYDVYAYRVRFHSRMIADIKERYQRTQCDDRRYTA